MTRLELGVFLPNAKQGFFFSSHAVGYTPSFEENLKITLLAEEIGLDYVFSMLKWRGFGGATQFWDASLESFSLMAALAPLTKRLGLIATVNPLLVHPAVMAKMAATIDEVSGGRLGLNLVTGASLDEYSQMGIIPPGYDQNRYAYATEWVQILKRLWVEPSVTHHGQYFHLQDCVSDPKPVQRPGPFLVCAASSDEGFRFTAREANYSFVSREGRADCIAESLRAKRIAIEENRTIKTAIPVAVILRDTASLASAYLQNLVDGTDFEAMGNIGRTHSRETREGGQRRGEAYSTRQRPLHMGLQILGGPNEVAKQIIGLAEAGTDSLLLIFPDYLDGMQRFSEGVLPLLRRTLDVGQPPV